MLKRSTVRTNPLSVIASAVGTKQTLALKKDCLEKGGPFFGFGFEKTIFSIEFSPVRGCMSELKNIKPISYVKANAAKVLDHVCETRSPYIVTQNGEARGVLLDIDTYQSMQDGLKLFKLFAQSEGEVAKGKIIRQKDLFASLEKELNAK